MAVIGGTTKSLLGRVLEIAGWWPLLGALAVLGGVSFLNQVTGMPMPGWMEMPMGVYHGMRDVTLATTLGPDIDPRWADAAFAGVSLFTLAARRILSFAFSIGGFVGAAAIAWFLLKQFG